MLGGGLAISSAVNLALWHRLRREEREMTMLRQVSNRPLAAPNVLSHEIRTPLSLIAGAAELLDGEEAGDLTPTQHQFVDIITSNSKIVIDMAEDFLYASRLQAQLFELHLSRFDCRLMAQEIIENIRQVHSTAISLDTDTTPIWIEGDRRLLKQALWNLVNNALRHGGKAAAIRLRVSKNDTGAFFSVSDSGKGLQLRHPADLFTPFKVSSTASNSVGLGLSITEKIVTLHGGKILIDTIENYGSTILVSLPAKPATATAATTMTPDTTTATAREAANTTTKETP